MRKFQDSFCNISGSFERCANWVHFWGFQGRGYHHRDFELNLKRDELCALLVSGIPLRWARQLRFLQGSDSSVWCKQWHRTTSRPLPPVSVWDLFLSWQEKSRRLGPIVLENLFQAPNIAVPGSKSGKLTSSHVKYFLDNVLKPAMTQDFLYLIGCWSGQTNPEPDSETFEEDSQYIVHYIPKKTTSVCQPLTLPFTSSWNAAKRITSYTSRADFYPDDELTTRNNIIRMQSLIHSQFMAKVFKPMIKYDGVTAGLTTKAGFSNSSTSFFHFQWEWSQNMPEPNSVPRPSFIKCAHCRYGHVLIVYFTFITVS